MAIFAISDLHLSFNCDKPMDIFGARWENYTVKMAENWNKVVGGDDTVIIPGDISWATYIEDAVSDFEYIDKLNGKKIILKGNHDYWWTTLSKMNAFLSEHGFDSISILQNTAALVGNIAICGTRGWILPTSSMSEDSKIYERERQRLVLSLEDAKAKRAEKIIVAMHYPPCSGDFESVGFTDILKEYNVSECIYGHLHGLAQKSAPLGNANGIKMRLVACDYLKFLPVLIDKQTL